MVYLQQVVKLWYLLLDVINQNLMVMYSHIIDTCEVSLNCVHWKWWYKLRIFSANHQNSAPLLGDHNENWMLIYSCYENSKFDISLKFANIKWRYKHHINRTKHRFSAIPLGGFYTKGISISLDRDRILYGISFFCEQQFLT